MRDGPRVEGDGELGGLVDIEPFHELAVAHVGDDEHAAGIGYVQLDEAGEIGKGLGQVA